MAEPSSLDLYLTVQQFQPRLIASVQGQDRQTVQAFLNELYEPEVRHQIPADDPYPTTYATSRIKTFCQVLLHPGSNRLIGHLSRAGVLGVLPKEDECLPDYQKTFVQEYLNELATGYTKPQAVIARYKKGPVHDFFLRNPRKWIPTSDMVTGVIDLAMLVAGPRSKVGTVLTFIGKSETLQVWTSESKPQSLIRQSLQASGSFIEACEVAILVVEVMLQNSGNREAMTIRECSAMLSNFDSIADATSAFLIPMIQLEDMCQRKVISGGAGALCGAAGIIYGYGWLGTLHPALAVAVGVSSAALVAGGVRKGLATWPFWNIAHDISEIIALIYYITKDFCAAMRYHAVFNDFIHLPYREVRHIDGRITQFYGPESTEAWRDLASLQADFRVRLQQIKESRARLHARLGDLIEMCQQLPREDEAGTRERSHDASQPLELREVES